MGGKFLYRKDVLMRIVICESLWLSYINESLYCNVKLRPKWCMHDLDVLDIASRTSHKLATNYHFRM